MRDRPSIASGLLAVLVTAQCWLAWLNRPVPIGTLADALAGVADRPALYLGGAVVATVAAGFSGVVVVFAMSQGVERLAAMRQIGSARLEANWFSVVQQAFWSAALAVAAAFTDAAGHPQIAGWLFELALVSCLHSALRQLWLLRALVKAVRLGDAQPRPVKSTDEALDRG